MQNHAIQLFDAPATTERNGAEVDNRKVQDAAEELGGESGLVMKKVPARFERDSEGGERREKAAIITVNEDVGGNGQVIDPDPRNLGRNVGRHSAALRLAKEGENFGANINAVNACIGTEQSQQPFKLRLSEGRVVREVFPAG